jgi:hypothetical protein
LTPKIDEKKLNVNRGSIIASTIYRQDGAPLYRRGNTVLLVMVAFNIVLCFSTKTYYVVRNRRRYRVWGRMDVAERARYLATTADEGNKRLDFRFAS